MAALVAKGGRIRATEEVDLDEDEGGEELLNEESSMYHGDFIDGTDV